MAAMDGMAGAISERARANESDYYVMSVNPLVERRDRISLFWQAIGSS
jgi:hypothetical protein